MMQNRLKDRDRGGYTSDRYRPHDNYTNAFNMLAQIGLAEKEVTNSRHNAAIQAANAYTARKEQEFKRDSWLTESKLELNKYYAGTESTMRDRAHSMIDSSMKDYEDELLMKFKKEMEHLETKYGGPDGVPPEKRKEIEDRYNAQYGDKKKEVINTVNSHFAQTIESIRDSAKRDTDAFNMFDSDFSLPKFNFGEDNQDFIKAPKTMLDFIKKYHLRESIRDSAKRDTDAFNMFDSDFSLPKFNFGEDNQDFIKAPKTMLDFIKKYHLRENNDNPVENQLGAVGSTNDSVVADYDDLNNQKNTLIQKEVVEVEPSINLSLNNNTEDGNPIKYHPNTNVLRTPTPPHVERNPFWQNYKGSHQGFQKLGKKLARFFSTKFNRGGDI